MKASGRFWLLLILIFVACLVVAAVIAPASNTGFQDATAVIAFATMGAVAIERGLEIGWTLIDQAAKLGAYWPMSIIVPHITAIETETNNLLDPLFKQATAALEKVKGDANTAQGQVTALDSQLAQLRAVQTIMDARVKQATSLAPGSVRVANVSAAATAMSQQLDTALNAVGITDGAVRDELNRATLAVNNGLDIIGTFGDNPARRLASLLVGASIGALATGWIGANLFSAILGSPSSSILGGTMGILITGVVVGLGSGPTHELVKSLQSSKKSRQLQLATTTDDGSDSGDGGSAVARVAGQQLVRSPGRRTLAIRSTD